MKFLRWIALITFAISRAGGDRCQDCKNCDGGPLNSPGAAGLDACALNCIQAVPAATQRENNPSSDCICNGTHYKYLAIQAIANCAVASCNIAQDGAAAASVASTRCSQWSQTAPPILVTPCTGIPATPVQTPSTTTSDQGQGGGSTSSAGSGGNGGGGGGGLTRGDKIALGVGIRIGLPGAILVIWQLYDKCF